MGIFRLVLAGAIAAATLVAVAVVLLFPANPNGLDCGTVISPTDTRAIEQFREADIPEYGNVGEVIEACEGRRNIHTFVAAGGGIIGLLMAIGAYAALPVLTGSGSAPSPRSR